MQEKMVYYSRIQKQATPKVAFVFGRENEQIVCEADR